MIEKLFGGRRNICPVEFREREIRIERDCLIEVRDGIRDAKFFGKVAAGKKFLPCFFGRSGDGNLAVLCVRPAAPRRFVWLDGLAAGED